MEENNANTERKTPLSRGLTIKRGAKMLKSTFGLATVNHQVGATRLHLFLPSFSWIIF